jgi:ABC-type multidrug transport system fused ATPase/permease subunit
MALLPPHGSLRRLLRQVPPRRKRQLLLLLAATLAGAVAELLSLGAVLPFVAVLADPAKAARNAHLARVMEATGVTVAELPTLVSLVFAALILLAIGARLLLLRVNIRFSNALGAELGEALYARTLRRPYLFHVSRNTSQIIGSMNKVARIITGYVQPLLTGAAAAVVACAIVALLVAIEPLVALLGATLFGGCYLVIAQWVRRRLRHDGIVVAAANDERIQVMQEGLGGIRDVILDRAQDIYARRFSGIERRFRDAQARSQFHAGFPRLAVEAIGMLLLVGFAIAATRRGHALATLLPTVGAFALGAQKLMPLLQQVYAGWSAAINSQPSVDDVLDLLDFEPLPSSSADIPFRSAIRLERVDFAYDGGDAPTTVLHGIDLVIRRGEKIGIVGSTGSGKSTLVDIVMGLLPPSVGVLRVDEVAVTAANADAWQRHIAHVPQAIYLSDASIAENIAFGCAPEQIDRERLEAVARIACIHEHVAALPQGYATVVGERGVRLSGGQRQRIGIARALYKQVDVLVLDEATSALDDQTEREVMRGIFAAAADTTVIMIAHRLTTLRDCDRILHLGGGRILRETGYDALQDHETSPSN